MMKIATGTVVDGKVVLQGEALAEGAVVTVLAREVDEVFTVTADDENQLLAAMAQADRGEVTSWDDIRCDFQRSR